jgi:hypothetical protein
MGANERDPDRPDDERPAPADPAHSAAIDPPLSEGEPMRYYEVDVGILVRWPYGRGSEALTANGWVRYTELTKFAFEARTVTPEEFADMRAQIFPMHDDANGGH